MANDISNKLENLNVGAEISETVINTKYDLITRNLQEVMGEKRIKEVLKTRELKVYWGTATTGRPHIAYFVPMCKIADFLKAGCEVTILLADLHGFLDNMKAPWELMNSRANYYKIVITEMLKSINVPIEHLKFVQGTEYQLSREYTLDVYKLSTLVTEHDAKKAGAQVVKQVESPLLSGLLYPLLQGLDEHYLGIDCQFGGVDQRKIFTFCEENMPKLGYKKCSHLMNRMVPGLTGDKMSSSVPDSKIDLLDSEKDITRKIKKAFCEEGNIENNGILSFVEAVLMPIFNTIELKRKEEYGGDKIYTNFEDLKDDFKNKLVHPGDLKAAVIISINKLIKPIRQKFDEPKNLEEMYLAYPETKPKEKVQKKGKQGGNNKNVQLPITPGRLNIRVGQITKVINHPESDKLLIETVNFGNEIGERTILSGLNNLVPINDLENSLRPFLINLKPAKMGGIESQGMLLCSSKTFPDNTRKVEPLSVPSTAKPGDQIVIQGFESDKPDERLPPKKKIWETLQPEFKVDNKGNCLFQDKIIKMADNSGSVTSLSLRDGSIS